jgi:hypothetical protein
MIERSDAAEQGNGYHFPLYPLDPVAYKNNGRAFIRALGSFLYHAGSQGLNRLRKNSTGVPKGRLNLAQDASPGLNITSRTVPSGTAEHRSTVFQPSLTGLDPLDPVYPGLTSWAKFSRPFGTLEDFFRSL